MKEKSNVDSLRYPALLFCAGYVFLANTPDELRKHDARTLNDTLKARWTIADSDGDLFSIAQWNKVAPSSKLRSLFNAILRNVFAEPILNYEARLTVQEFIENIEPMLVEYRMYGNAYGTDQQKFLSDLQSNKSFSDVYKFIEAAV